jgi:hypothetical protein
MICISFIDLDSKWRVTFDLGYISIINNSNKNNITIKYCKEDSWIHEKIETNFNKTLINGKEISTKDFSLVVFVLIHEEEHSEGYLDILTNTISGRLLLPYKLALNIMNFL